MKIKKQHKIHGLVATVVDNLNSDSTTDALSGLYKEDKLAIAIKVHKIDVLCTFCVRKNEKKREKTRKQEMFLRRNFYERSF